MSENYKKNMKSRLSRFQEKFGTFAGQVQEGAVGAVDLLASTQAWSKLNDLSNSVTNSMDAAWHTHSGAEMLGGIKLTPSNHRFMWDDGHTVSESLKRAAEVGKEEGWTDFQTFVEWAKAYTSDLSSPSGMPAFGNMSDDIYVFLTKTLGIKDGSAQDFVTINGSEALSAIAGGTIAAAAVVFAWKNEDKETFSRAIGSIGVVSIVATNPVALSIMIVSLAIGYNKLVCQKAVFRGATLSAASVLVSGVIGGPFIVGFIPALVAAWYINKKMGKDFDVVNFTRCGWAFMRSSEFRGLAEGYYKEIEGIIKKDLHRKRAS